MKKSPFILGILFLLPLFQLHAQSVDLLWQGETYTPPFYLGGALWSGESRINMVAIPQGLGNSSQLFYKWTKDGTILGNINAVGRNFLSFEDTLFSKPVTIKVEIVAADESILAASSVTVTPSTSDLLIYESNPLYGFMFNIEASGGYRIPENEMSFAAFPLFFSTPGRDSGSLNYVWRSNAGEDGRESMVTYRIPEDTSGQSSVSIKATNSQTLRQTATKNFLVQFGNENQ